MTMYNVFLVVNFIVFTSFVHTNAESNNTFPKGFLFGVSTSAYQIEGAWNQDGKGENIWDHWIHTDPSRIKNNDNADVALDSYHQYKIDIALASTLEVSHYRFSISWSRLLPTGRNTSAKIDAITYYQDLINRILASNMTPVATLYYYDLPQPLQELGGWTNPDMVTYFADYARIAFEFFPNVQYWITFNDPKTVCRLGYGLGTYAPGIAHDGIDDYMCSYIILKSHAAAYHVYKKEFPTLRGKVSIALDVEWSEPATNSAADQDAAERRNLFEFGIYGHPIFIGNWPQVVIDRVANRSRGEKLEKSRLPEFTRQEIDYIKGTTDFMAINTYTTHMVSDIDEPEYGNPSYAKDMRAKVFLDESWTVASNENPVVAWGVRKALNWLKTTYNNPEIFITETGVSDTSLSTEDYDRIYFFAEYLQAILDAMYEDNVTVFGFTARSLMDEFEWTEGYSQYYGFHRTDANRRDVIFKRSSYFYTKLTRTLRIPIDDYTTTQTPYVTPTTPGAANRMARYPTLVLIVTYLCFLMG